MTKFYINDIGEYVGGFDGALPPKGSIEVPFPPTDARFKWDGTKWTAPDHVKADMVLEARKSEYSKRGASIEELVVALWERVVESKPASSDAIEVIRQAVKTEYPK